MKQFLRMFLPPVLVAVGVNGFAEVYGTLHPDVAARWAANPEDATLYTVAFGATVLQLVYLTMEMPPWRKL